MEWREVRDKLAQVYQTRQPNTPLNNRLIDDLASAIVPRMHDYRIDFKREQTRHMYVTAASFATARDEAERRLVDWNETGWEFSEAIDVCEKSNGCH